MENNDTVLIMQENHKVKFQLVAFLSKRLDHTIAHTQIATKLIYLVNAAILAAVYFGFGKLKPISVSFLAAAALLLLLSVVNFLHANLLAVQNAWYRTIDVAIRNVFLSMPGVVDVWPNHLGITMNETLSSYGHIYSIFPFHKAHRIYVFLHFVVAIFLFFVSLLFFYFAHHTPNITFMTT